MDKVTILVRKAKALDIPFLTNSWLESFRDGNMVRGIPNRVYFPHHHRIVEQLLSRSIVLVACPEENPDIIMGWICAEVTDVGMMVHYVYTKNSFRKFGVASRLYTFLLETETPSAILCSHMNPVGVKLAKKVNATYNPYFMFMSLPDGWEREKQ